MRLKPLASALLATTMVTQLAACGTVFYPERRGQLSGEIDGGVAVLNALGLLFYIVPGVVAFAVDFATGAIYLPDQRYSVNPVQLDQAVDAGGQVDTHKLGVIIRKELDIDLPLDQAVQVVTPEAQQLALLGLSPRA